jgi:hypothetical protein
VLFTENMSATINYLCVIHCENMSATITFVLFTVKTCLLPLITFVLFTENMSATITFVFSQWKHGRIIQMTDSWLPYAHFHPYQVIDKHWWRRSLISLNNLYAHSSEQIYVLYRAVNPKFWCRGK